MLKHRKQGLAILLITALLALALAGCGGGTTEKDADNAQPKVDTTFINIATGGTAGTYYPLGGAIAEILNKNVEGVNATAESTGASVANINLLKEGNVQIAFVQNDITYYADKGEEMFKDQKVAGLKALATIYPETCQLITLKDNNITSVADLKGKKVAVGAAGSGVEANARQIMAAEGITYDDIDEQYLSFAEAANGLKDGNIDAGFITAGFPTAAIQDLAAQHDVVLIPVADATADKLIADYPFYTKIVIPAGTYQNQAEDVNTLAVKAMLVVTDDMDDQLAYDITKAIYSNLDTLKAAHAVGALIVPETAKEGMSVPMHPGAEKYFNE